MYRHYDKNTGTVGMTAQNYDDPCACSNSPSTANSYGLETIKSSEINDLPRIKERLKKLELENAHMRDHSKILQRKLDYWRGQSAELAELRKIKYSISKDKNKSVIRALKRGIL